MEKGRSGHAAVVHFIIRAEHPTNTAKPPGPSTSEHGSNLSGHCQSVKTVSPE